jgi:hypothetical protein
VGVWGHRRAIGGCGLGARARKPLGVTRDTKGGARRPPRWAVGRERGSHGMAQTGGGRSSGRATREIARRMGGRRRLLTLEKEIRKKRVL